MPTYITPTVTYQKYCVACPQLLNSEKTNFNGYLRDTTRLNCNVEVCILHEKTEAKGEDGK